MSRERLRILLVAHSPALGGAEYCLDTTLRHLDRSKFEPLVVFPFDGPMVQRTNDLGIDTMILPMCHWLYFKKDFWYWRNLLGRCMGNIRRFSRLLREREIDLVYTNTAAVFEAAVAAKRSGVRHVWHVHEVFKPGNQMSQLLPLPLQQRLICKYSDLVVFESESAQDSFSQSVRPVRAEVVYNSVRIEGIAECDGRRCAVRDGLGLPRDAVVAAVVGQLIDRKNPQVFVEALSQLKTDQPVFGLIVGEGPLEADLRHQIQRQGLASRCKIVPFQKDIVPLMNAIDILVLPSRQESFGLVLVEAGAMGKPVVACRSEGPCEIIADGETGFLVDQDDAQAIAGSLDYLAESVERRRAAGEAGRRNVAERFDAARNTRRLESLFDSCVSTSSRNASEGAPG